MVVIHRDVYSPQKDVMAARHDNSKNYNNTDGYGIAADIGTTTVAISLFSLGNNRYCGNITENNSQTELGARMSTRPPEPVWTERAGRWTTSSPTAVPPVCRTYSAAGFIRGTPLRSSSMRYASGADSNTGFLATTTKIWS